MVMELLQPSQLLSKLQTLRGTKDPVVILFSATKKENGERWCPDCEAADPVLEEAFTSAPASVLLLTVEVTREEWKTSPGPEHPLRKAPYSVSGIPTMLEWDATNDKALRRFGESDLLQLESVSEFFRAFGERR